MYDDYEGERFILFSFFFCPVITKELATGESLLKKFGEIPKGSYYEDRVATAIKLGKKNLKRFVEKDEDPTLKELGFEIDEKYWKKIQFEWVGRSW